MKEGWSYKKLGEVCEVISGQSPEGKFYNTEGQGTPFYQGKKEFSSKYIGNPTTWTTVETKIAEKDDLLMSVRAPVGDINFATQRLCIGRGLAAIRTKEDIDKEYLFYFLVAQKSCIKGKEGVGFASINRKEIMDIDVQYPKDFSEQRSIVTRLDAAFSHIDALKANAEKQLNEARKLFQAELTECMKPKEGWEEKTLKEVSEIAGEYGLNASSKPFDGVRYLRITDITDFGYLNDDKVSANVEDGKKQDELVEGDILFARTGATVGKTLVYRKDFGDCLFAGYLIRYRLKKDCILPRFIHYITHSKEYYKWVETNQEAAAQPNISAKKYNMLFIRYPNIDVQHRIVSHLDSLSSTIRKLEELQQKTFAECDALKQAMLREVFE